jgi:glucose-6-phosphate 1-dehydrogenase
LTQGLDIRPAAESQLVELTDVECWRIVEEAQEAWRSGQVPLQEYAAGSAGPSDWT